MRPRLCWQAPTKFELVINAKTAKAFASGSRTRSHAFTHGTSCPSRRAFRCRKHSSRPPEQRLYQLVRQGKPGKDHTFEIDFLDPGAEAFAFTFG
jgi:Thioredoxin like C-terminal domain